MIQSYIRKPTIPNFYVPSFCRGLWIFDSTTNKIIDYSQYQNHGTNNGSMPKGYSNLFNGISDYIDLPNSTSLDITTAPLAIFATFKTNSAVAQYIVTKNETDFVNMQYGIQYSGSRVNFILEDGSSALAFTDAILQQNTWYNSGFIWDGKTISPYLNFNKNGTQGNYTSTLTSRSTVSIGRRAPNNIFFNGNIANVSVYASLDINEIMKHQKILSKQFNIRW